MGDEKGFWILSKTSSPLRIVRCDAEKVHVNPKSHNLAIEIKDLRKPGKMWATNALSGKCGKFNSPMCDDLSMDPSGKKTSIPFGLTWTSLSDDESWMAM